MCEIGMIGVFVLLSLGSHAVVGETFQHNSGSNDTNRVFSPRMDYDEWTPLGRGDPLKNDPTFDYVPPVLDRVQYWLGESQSSSTEPSLKRDVLILGVTAKKTSPKIPEHFLKFMDSSEYAHEPTSNLHQGIYSSRNDFIGSTGAEPPKVIRNTKFRSGPSSMEYRITNPKYFSSNSHFGENTKPHTMMLPPPPANYHQDYSSGKPSTSSSVTFEKSNLIYHTSQQVFDWTASGSNGYPSPVRNPNPSLFAWPTDPPENDRFEDDHHQVSASMNHEVVVVGQNTQNANIIVDNSEDNLNTQVVIGQKNSVEIEKPDEIKEHEIKDKPEMEIVLANSLSTVADMKNETVTIVMPTNYHVETTTPSDFADTTTPIPMTTTLRISSTTTSLPSPMPLWPQELPPSLLPPPRIPSKFFPRKPQAPEIPNMSITAMPHLMMHQSFRPTTPRSLSSELIQKNGEMIVTTPTPSTTTTAATTTTTTTTARTTTTSTTTVAPFSTSMTSKTTTRKTTPNQPSMNIGKFTSNPISSDYQQSSKPVNGPLYLIIQGHSKVKTYKPTVSKHDVIAETTVRPMTKFEKFVNENTRRAATTIRTVEEVTSQKMVHGNLMNLVEKGLSAFSVSSETTMWNAMMTGYTSPHCTQ